MKLHEAMDAVLAERPAGMSTRQPFFAERDLRRITSQDVQDLMTMMENGERPGPKAKGDRRCGRPVGAKSVRNYIGYLSALLGFAERKGWLPVNVARHVELPGKPESAEIRFLEPLEVRALADAAVDGPYCEIDRAMYLTAAMTGLRQGELVALRWRDVDWAAGRIRVVRISDVALPLAGLRGGRRRRSRLGGLRRSRR